MGLALQDQYNEIKGQTTRPGPSHVTGLYGRTPASPLPAIPTDDLHDPNRRSIYHVYNDYDTQQASFSGVGDDHANAPSELACSEHIYESAYSPRPFPVTTPTASASASVHKRQAEHRQKSIAKEYYEMRGTPQNTLESSDQQQLKY